MAFKMRGAPFPKAAFKDPGHGNPDPHSHESDAPTGGDKKAQIEALRNKIGVLRMQMRKGSGEVGSSQQKEIDTIESKIAELLKSGKPDVVPKVDKDGNYIY